MNKYKLMSYIFLIIFFLLSTVQTLLDIQINFGVSLLPETYIFSLVASFIPVGVIVLLTNCIKNKTKYSNIFVVYDIQFVIKLMFYITLFSIFLIWSMIFISSILIIYHQNIDFNDFVNFTVIRIIYTVIYSFIISMFFNSISKPSFKVKK